MLKGKKGRIFKLALKIGSKLTQAATRAAGKNSSSPRSPADCRQTSPIEILKPAQLVDNNVLDSKPGELIR